MRAKFDFLASFGLAVFAAIAWPEIRRAVNYLLSPSVSESTVSIFIFLIYLVITLLAKKQSAVSASNTQPLYVRVFVSFFFLLGLASLVDPSPSNIPVERGLGAFFHVILLWGAALIVTDLVRAAYYKFTFKLRG